MLGNITCLPPPPCATEGEIHWLRCEVSDGLEATQPENTGKDFMWDSKHGWIYDSHVECLCVSWLDLHHMDKNSLTFVLLNPCHSNGCVCVCTYSTTEYFIQNNFSIKSTFYLTFSFKDIVHTCRHTCTHTFEDICIYCISDGCV